MNPHTDQAELREEVARLIDPSKWRVLDSYLADMLRKYQGEDIGYDPAAFKDKASLAVADAVLSLIGQQLAKAQLEASRLEEALPDRAAALIVAEIERLDRAALSLPKPKEER